VYQITSPKCVTEFSESRRVIQLDLKVFCDQLFAMSHLFIEGNPQCQIFP